jgi:hypothetical protein
MEGINDDRINLALLCRSIYQIVAEASGVGVPKVIGEEQSRFVAHFSA